MNITIQRRTAFRLAATALAAASLSGTAFAQDDEGGSYRHGKLFMSTNATTGNQVLVYNRVTGGLPTLLATIPTQGTGTGAGLGSQGAVTLSRSGRHLFVVNAASNTISTFTFGGGTMTLTSVVDSGGTTPISVTEWNDVVYVVNTGGNGNVSGYRNTNGVLTPLADGVRPLSQQGGAGPGQISFNTFGDVLVVTEKNTARLTSWSVLPSGNLTRRAVTPSSGATPFGFAFTNNDTMIVSEAPGSAVSSYRFVDNSRMDAPRLVTASLPNGQGAACWIAVTPNGRFAFSANAGTSSVSSFTVARDGRLALLDAAAGLTGNNAGAVDMAVSPDGQQLHVFASRTPQIVSFTISPMGALAPLGVVTGAPLGSAGIAAN